MFGQMQPIGSRSVQFVNGRMSAEAYAMAPNSQEILMDTRGEPCVAARRPADDPIQRASK